MLVFFAAVLAGLTLLVWSADRFVDGAVVTARKLGMSPLLVGLTIVAFGTSAPELVVSLMAALSGSPSLAVGNALGSNIANIGLVLGITALISPTPLNRIVLKRELPILLVATLAVFFLFLDQHLSLLDGILFLLMLAAALFLLARSDGEVPEFVQEVSEHPDQPMGKAILWLVISLVVLSGSARLLVWGASGIALELGVSELIVGLTIVAIGTSLPELAASVASALKGHHDVAVGNIVGSNLFNLLAVLAIPALVTPLALETETLVRDYGTMGLLTVLLALFAYLMQRKGKLARFEGGILLAVYAGYSVFLYHAATGGLTVQAFFRGLMNGH